jgi:hypothetical protein
MAPSNPSKIRARRSRLSDWPGDADDDRPFIMSVSTSSELHVPAPNSRESQPFVLSASSRSKAEAMSPEIARNQDYDDYYANDRKDIHSALLPPMMTARVMRAHHPSFRHRRPTSTVEKQVQVFVNATAYIPNSHPLRRAERARRQ